MKLIRIFLLLYVVALISSCGGKSPQKEPPAGVSGQSSGKYEIKSGIIEYRSIMSGSEAVQTLSFDNYGEEEKLETVMNVSNIRITTVSIAKDGFIYSYNPATKTGTKVEILGRQSSIIDFRNLSEEVRRKMNLEIVDTVLIDERTCLQYSVDWVERSMTGLYSVWKGITVESEIKILNTDMVMTATNIVENPVIPPEKFELPADIRLN